MVDSDDDDLMSKLYNFTNNVSYQTTLEMLVVPGSGTIL